MEKLIAIVDDERDILNLVSHHLRREGYKTKEFQDSRNFLMYVESIVPDLTTLDICRAPAGALQISMPIIMLTAKGTEADVVVGLEIGADDYIIKPFSPRELVARIKTVLRRSSKKETEQEVVQLGDLTINTQRYEVYVKKSKIDLTTTEFKILESLVNGNGRVFTRDQLLKQKRLWGDDKLIYDRTIDVHIKNLRDKLGSSGKMIKTIRSIGYKLDV